MAVNQTLGPFKCPPLTFWSFPYGNDSNNVLSSYHALGYLQVFGEWFTVGTASSHDELPV